MLAIKIKKGNSFMIGDDIMVTIVGCGKAAVKVAIKAPDHKKIIRLQPEEKQEDDDGIS